MGVVKQQTQDQQSQYTHLLTFAICATALLICVMLVSWNGQNDTAEWLAEEGSLRVKAIAAMTGFKPCNSKSSEPACAIMHSYVSSELEQAWLDNVGTWQDAFCSSLNPTEQLTQLWLKAQAAYDAALQQGSQNPVEVLQQQQLLDPRVFSQFKTKIDCGSSGISEQVTWIEPLAHGLRHPDSLCNRGTTVFNRTYLVPAHSSEVRSLRDSSKLSCQGRDCQNIYLDLGATTLVPGPGEPGQGWFFYTYAKQGIVFDRFLLWEAKPRSPEEVFKHVPKPHLDRYQYYNIPVSADTADPSSPINVLKRVAQAGDFVVFKMDIDNWAIEGSLMKALFENPAALALIDEFYFEDHVKFSEMLGWWDNQFNPKQYDPSKSLADSYQQFLKLRQLGMRAHSWV